MQYILYIAIYTATLIMCYLIGKRRGYREKYDSEKVLDILFKQFEIQPDSEAEFKASGKAILENMDNNVLVALGLNEFIRLVKEMRDLEDKSK